MAFLIAAMSMMGACRGHRPDRDHKQEKQERVLWKPIASWTGHGNLQTDSFEMATGNWRVAWQAHNPKDPKAGLFRVSVHSAISGRPLETAVEHRGDGRDIDYVDEDPRVFFLVIDAPGMDWSVTVEEPLIEDTSSTGSPPG